MHCTIKEESACKKYLLGLTFHMSKGFEGVDGLIYRKMVNEVSFKVVEGARDQAANVIKL